MSYDAGVYVWGVGGDAALVFMHQSCRGTRQCPFRIMCDSSIDAAYGQLSLTHVYCCGSNMVPATRWTVGRWCVAETGP